MRTRALVSIAIASILVFGGAISPTAAVATEADCPTVYYRTTNTYEAAQRRTLVASDEASTSYVGELRWCLATNFNQITNSSAAVWIINGTTAAPRGSTALMNAMRTQVSIAFNEADLNAPAFVLPGETVAIGPNNFDLSIDTGLTRQWIAFSAIGAPLVEFVDLYTSHATPKWNAAWKCAEGAARFVETATLDQITVEEVIGAAYSAPETAKSCKALASKTQKASATQRNLKPKQIVVRTPLAQLTKASSGLDDLLKPATARAIVDAVCAITPNRFGC